MLCRELTGINGDTLLLKWEDSDGSRVSISSEGRVLSYLMFKECSSCKGDSSILEVSELLQDEFLYNALSEYARSIHMTGDDVPHAPRGRTKKKVKLTMMFFVIPCGILLLGCGYIAWIRASQLAEPVAAPEELVTTNQKAPAREEAHDYTCPPKVRIGFFALLARHIHPP